MRPAAKNVCLAVSSLALAAISRRRCRWTSRRFMGRTEHPASLPLLRSAEEVLRLKAAVRYPGAVRKASVIVAVGAAVMLLVFVLSVSVEATLVLGVLAWLAGTVLTIGRDNRVMEVALRIFDDHPEYTPQEAANAARRELGLPVVRYP